MNVFFHKKWVRYIPKRRIISIKNYFETIFGLNAKFCNLYLMLPIVNENVTNIEYAS